jgi:hypothetical protein
VLTPTSGGKAVGFDSMVTFEIDDGRNTYVMATFPNNQLVGQVLTSNH